MKLLAIKVVLFAKLPKLEDAAKRYYDFYTLRLEQLLYQPPQHEVVYAKEKLLEARNDLLRLADKLESYAAQLRQLPIDPEP